VTAPPPTPSSGSGVSDEELELTFNHDARSYVLETGYGDIAIGVDDLDGTLARLHEQGIEPEREPHRVREGGLPLVPSKIRTATASS
jgi:hypothetical protein